MTDILPFVVSVLLGFLIGLERERSRSTGNALGLRTFSLLAILGSLAGWLRDPWLTGALSVFSLGLVILAYYRETKPGPRVDRGITTEVAAGIVFLLGYASHRDPALVALLSAVVVLLLFWKAPLHRFSNRIEKRELEAALLLVLLGISVLSLLKDEVIDPWGLFSPRKFGIVVLLVATVEFSSYLAVKFIGPGKSPLVIGFLAGLVSSTTLVLNTAKFARERPETWRYLAATAVIGISASLAEVVLIVSLVSPVLLPWSLALVGGALAVGAAAAAWLLRAAGQHRDPGLELRSPLDWLSVLRLSLLLGLILAAVAAAQRYAGDLGRLSTTALAGLFELHGVALATATLFERDQLPLASVFLALTVAVSASFVAKAALAWITARDGKFSWALSLVLLAMALTVIASGWLLPRMIPVGSAG